MVSTRRMILMIAVFIMFLPVLSLAGTVNLPRTGQTTCYDASGKVINCKNTGQDGDIQAGMVWPVPRFTDNKDGTITDNLTGLMWLKDANCFGSKTWQRALYTVVEFNADPDKYGCQDYTANYIDWRLPNVNEIESLVNAEQPNITLWLRSQGFTHVQLSAYWSSTTQASKKDEDAWIIGMWYGFITNYFKTYNDDYVWPVRTGQVGALGNLDISFAPVWKTGQRIRYASGDDGNLQKGVSWPTPRFTNNGDGTVTDNLTGLMWLKDANCIKTKYPGFDKDGTSGDGRITWQHALDFVAGINAGTYSNCGAGHNDWRLPNRKELRSLTDFSEYGPALPSGHPFTNVLAGEHWSSTTYASNTFDAWYVDIRSNGYTGYNSKDSIYYVWPVRAGRLFQPQVPLRLASVRFFELSPSIFVPSIFGKLIIPPDIMGSFTFVAEVVDSSTKASISSDRITFNIR